MGLGTRRDLRSAALAICFLLIALIAPPLLGQPMFRSVESVETMVANADVIVVGRVARFDTMPEIRVPGFPMGFPVDLVVEEILKGKAAPRLTVPLPVSERSLLRWRDGGALLLVAIPRKATTPAVVIDLGDPQLAVLTADLNVLRSEEVVTRAVREAIGVVTAEADHPEGYWLSVPHDLIAGTVLSSGVTNVRVRVPIDARLERRALAILSGEQKGSRSAAVSALRYFKSDSNVRVLMALLADTTLTTQESAENNLGHEILDYHIRRSAYGTLTSWGLAPPKPVLQVDTYKPELVEVVSWASFTKSTTLADLTELRSFPNLWSLDLMGNKLADGAFREIAALGGLRELRLYGSNVTDADLKVLSNLAKLEHLDLTDTRITDAGLPTLARFRALKEVGLNSTPVTARGVAELRGRRPGLTIIR